MVRLLSFTIAAAAAATAAVAAPTAPAPAPATIPAAAPARPAAAHLFLSPSGEPFRQGPSDPDPMKAWFDQVDAAHKGYIDRAAFRADAVRFFKKLDENGDGVIDGFEVADYEAKIVPELGEWAEGRFPGEFGQAGQKKAGGRERGGDGGHRGHGPQQRGIEQLIDEPEPVSGADFALDSHITAQEWLRATDQRFEILDQNKDGRVTPDELRARFLPIK